MYIGGGRILKREVMKFRPCIGRTISLCILSFMLFFLTITSILPSVEGEEKKLVFFFSIIFFLLHVLCVLYSLLKLNLPVCLDENKIVQKQFGKIISIKYDNITDVKLSSAFYARVPYAIKLYYQFQTLFFYCLSKL